MTSTTTSEKPHTIYCNWCEGSFSADDEDEARRLFELHMTGWHPEFVREQGTLN